MEPSTTNPFSPQNNLDIHEKLPDTDSVLKTQLKRYAFPATIVILLIIVVIGIIAYASRNTLPGDALYGYKTSITENLIAFTKFSSSAQSEYDTKRLETRLDELKTLSRDNASSSPENIQAIAKLTNIHAQDLVHDVNGLSPESQIDALAHGVSVMRAEEIIADNNAEFESIADSLQESRGVVNDALESAIGSFTSTSPTDSVFAYLGIQIKDVSESIKTVARGSDAERYTVARVSDTEDAIQDGKMDEAINSILRAKQAITVDSYLWDSERGPTEGAQTAPTEIPEGS